MTAVLEQALTPLNTTSIMIENKQNWWIISFLNQPHGQEGEGGANEAAGQNKLTSQIEGPVRSQF